MSGFMQTSFFFGYMWTICYGFFLMLGNVGFRASKLFVMHIYKAIKCEGRRAGQERLGVRVPEGAGIGVLSFSVCCLAGQRARISQPVGLEVGCLRWRFRAACSAERAARLFFRLSTLGIYFPSNDEHAFTRDTPEWCDTRT